MHSRELLLKALDLAPSFYAAVLHPGRWPETLAILADFLESNSRMHAAPGALADLPDDAQAAVLGVRKAYLDAAIGALAARGAYPDALTPTLGAEAAATFRDWALTA